MNLLTNETKRITIDLEFQNLIPPLMSEERNQLKLSILREGCRDPLVIWNKYNILLDGHNRYSICLEYGITFRTIEIELSDRTEAISWIINNQLGRRNLTRDALSYLRGKLYNQFKKSKSNPRGKNQHRKNQDFEVGCQNDNQPKTVDVVALRFQVSSSTISRDARYAQAVDAVVEIMGEDFRPNLLSRNAQLSKKQIISLANLANQNPNQVKKALTEKYLTIEGFLLQNEHLTCPQKDFPYVIGEVCRIIKAYHEPKLKGCEGCWAIVMKVYNYCCDVALWNGTIQMIKPENLVSLEFTESQRAERQKLCSRIQRLKECPLEPTAQSILSILGREKQPYLTSFQEKLLSFIEHEYGITE